MKRLTLAAALAALLFVLTGCDPTGGGGAGVAIVDLSEVAAATGQDVVIRDKAAAGRDELTAQLQELASRLDGQLAAERERIGESPSEEDSAQLQQLLASARAQLSQAQQQAQEQATQMETTLISEYRDELMPIAEEVAAKRGVKLVLSADSAYVFWRDESIDISADIIAAWRAKNPAPQKAGPASDAYPGDDGDEGDEGDGDEGDEGTVMPASPAADETQPTP